MERKVAISTGPLTHLDHLAPLCALLDIPLIVTELDHLELAQKYYPMITTHYISLEDLTLAYIAREFDTLIVCGKFWAMEMKPQLKLLFNKEIKILFAPHGNSDKESLLDNPIKQDVSLVYGPQMARLKKGEETVEIGNVRLWFYKEHQAHFDQLAHDSVFSKCDANKKTILYAPTWETKATKTSFFESAGMLIETLANDYNLVVKLHPLLEENNPSLFYRILGKYEERAFFLLNFPLVYPLLEKTDIYLGDYSSIGYDFLYYDRPLFFLKEGGALQKCGEIFENSQSLLNSQQELSGVRNEMYQDAFGKKETLLKE